MEEFKVKVGEMVLNEVAKENVAKVLESNRLSYGPF